MSSNNNNKLMVIAPIILAVLFMTPLLTVQRVSAIDRNDMSQPYFNVNKDGTTTFSSTPITTDHSTSTSTSKAQSASSADSQNNVKCFAFCLGISNANSQSAANSDSRTNSPGNTAVAQPQTSTTTATQQSASADYPGLTDYNNNHLAPVGRVFNPNTATVDELIQHSHHEHPVAAAAAASAAATTSGGTQCLDITGSVEDQGYAQGYVDGNRDSVHLNGHGFDDSLSGHHTEQFRQGYHNGYLAGWNDGKNGINLQPC